MCVNRSYRGIFDTCVESLSGVSKADINRDTITKRDEYAAAGVQEYYILDERGIETEFYQLTSRGVYRQLPRRDGVVGSQVLPGFQFRVSDLYRKPTPPEMILDPVYSSFISPFYRSERQRADRYAAILIAAGLLPPE